MKKRGNKYLRRVKLRLEGNQMTLRPPRTGLALVTSVILDARAKSFMASKSSRTSIKFPRWKFKPSSAAAR